MASRASRAFRRLISGVVGAAVEFAIPVLLVILWWLASSGSKSFYYPPLSGIVRTLRDVWFARSSLPDVERSISNLLEGLLLASAAGVVLGLVIGRSPLLRTSLEVPLSFLRSIPPVTIVPIALLVLGIGPRMQVSVIAFGSVWPVLISTIDGASGIEPTILEVSRCYRLRAWDRVTRVMLPAVSPQITAGMRTSLAVAVTMMISSEFIGANQGIGYRILSAQQAFASQEVWAGLILLGILGYALNLAFRAFESRVLWWQKAMGKAHDSQ